MRGERHTQGRVCRESRRRLTWAGGSRDTRYRVKIASGATSVDGLCPWMRGLGLARGPSRGRPRPAAVLKAGRGLRWLAGGAAARRPQLPTSPAWPRDAASAVPRVSGPDGQQHVPCPGDPGSDVAGIRLPAFTSQR